MAVTLTLREPPPVPLEVEGILPTVFASIDKSEWARQTVFLGKEKQSLGDWFQISGDPHDDTLRWEGDLSRVHWIGKNLNSGTIEIRGDAGRHVGSEMTGGRIEVFGDVGDWLGGEMKGGQIVVHGNAGHLVGSAYRGSPVGMRGGEIIVEGNAGNEIGHSQRRGLIAIGGDVGDLAGFAMRAGTIVIGGQAGIRHGAEMIRGTLIYLTDANVELLPTFRAGVTWEPVVLRLLARRLAQIGFPAEATWGEAPYRQFHGDFLCGGRGECFLPVVA